MTLQFPNTPTDGQVYTDTNSGNRWVWDSANTVWKSTSTFTQTITVSSSQPGSPVVGQLWWNQDYGRLFIYYNDGTSNQWVDATLSPDISGIYGVANISYNAANSSLSVANSSYASINSNWTVTNTAFGKANTALQNTTGTFAGTLTVTGDVVSGGTLQALSTVQSSSGADLSLNANGANRDIIAKVNGTELARLVGSTTNLGLGINAPESKLHVKTGTATSAMAVNAQTAILIEGNAAGLLQFRQSADNGVFNGTIFTDNNVGGYIIHGNGGNGDSLRLGGYSGIYFDVGAEQSTTGVAIKTNRGYVDTNGLYIVGTLRSSSTSQKYGVSSATAVTVSTATPTTIASVTITTTGKPVLLIGSGDCNPNAAGDWNYIAIYRDSTRVGKFIINQTSGASYNNPFGITHIDTPGAGTYTYTLKANQGSGTITYGETGNDQAPTIVAVELI